MFQTKDLLIPTSGIARHNNCKLISTVYNQSTSVCKSQNVKQWQCITVVNINEPVVTKKNYETKYVKLNKTFLEMTVRFQKFLPEKKLNAITARK